MEDTVLYMNKDNNEKNKRFKEMHFPFVIYFQLITFSQYGVAIIAFILNARFIFLLIKPFVGI